ncbi:hypothetical protein AgCh_034562 [Apium graveolens]
MQAISSSLAKVSKWSPTLKGEGTEEWEEPIVSELRDVNEAEKKQLFQQDYQAVLDSISYEDEAFTHPVPAYQVLAEQDNAVTERNLYLLHTTAFMQRAKDAIIAIPSTTDANTKSLLHAHLECLQLCKIQSLKQNQDVSEIKIEIGQVKKNITKRLESMLPASTLLDINRQLRKNSDLSSKGETNSIIPVNQGESASEWERVLNINVSKQQLNWSSVKKWKKIDDKIEKKFGPIEKQDKVFSHFSQLRPILADDMSLGNMERGQPSTIKSPKANVIFHPKRNYPKNSNKNPLDLVYKTPKSDEKKLLPRSIAFFKDPRDSVLKKRIANIYRNGKMFCVVAGHPQFANAKKE